MIGFSLRRYRAFLISAVIAVTCVHKGQASVGTEGASFLDIPVGAAPAALGSAYSALANNAYAPVWNPGGLGFLKGAEAAAQHVAYVQAIRYEYFSFVMPIGAPADNAGGRGFGLSIQDLGSGDIPRTDVLNGAPVTHLGSFSSHWGAYNLSYGQTVTEKLALGITGKWIHGRIDDVSAGTYGFDFGSLYRYSESLSFAATVLNAGAKLKFLTNKDSLPLAVHAGARYRLNQRWQFSGESIYRQTGMASAQAGAQWQPLRPLALRLGYQTDHLKGLSPLAGLTLGTGLQLWGHELAYAWVPYGELGYAQYLSLQMRFGAQDGASDHLLRYETRKPAPLQPDDLETSLLLNEVLPDAWLENAEARRR